MGKLTSFATGMGEGYLAGKRYKDNKKRQDRQDEVMEKILAAPATQPESLLPLGMDDESAVELGLKRKMANGGIVRGYANGGMIADNTPMPSHSCKMSWQRQSFKK
jgi:hypothetical protein